jgi:SNF2 family DNA or RNA helicase
VKVDVETELPDKIERVIKVELSAWQSIIYSNIVDDNATGKLGHVALRNKVMQLRKICNHPYLF